MVCLVADVILEFAARQSARESPQRLRLASRARRDGARQTDREGVMDAPLASPAGIGTPDELREFIAENLNLARIEADLGVTYAELGDDVGLGYAVRKLVAYTRAVVVTMRDLETEKKGSRDDH